MHCACTTSVFYKFTIEYCYFPFAAPQVHSVLEDCCFTYCQSRSRDHALFAALIFCITRNVLVPHLLITKSLRAIVRRLHVWERADFHDAVSQLRPVHHRDCGDVVVIEASYSIRHLISFLRLSKSIPATLAITNGVQQKQKVVSDVCHRTDRLPIWSKIKSCRKFMSRGSIDGRVSSGR